jgi:tetratricopeptide (TPR) repeat protein
VNTRTLVHCVLLVALSASPALAQAPLAPQAPRERDLVLESTATLAKPTGVPRGYALVIGVSDYANLDEKRQLQFAESDARTIYRTLISQQGGAFPAENVHLLLGRQATRAAITRELEEWLPSVAGPADRVVVYFAGHGFVKNGVGFLAPYDVHPDRLETTGYPMKQLGDVLANRVKAQWKVLLADACHSGKVNAETTNEAMDQQFSSLPANFLTLTATTEREASHEDPKLSTGFGFYTYFLAQAWTGNADNDPCDGRITADELIDYVRNNVRRYARDRNVSQTPTAYGDYDPEMLLGVSLGCLNTGPNSSTSMLGTAIVEVNLDQVDIYVDDQLVGRVGSDKPLILPRLTSGPHVFKGVRDGYQPDVKEVLIAPGQDVTVTLRIRYRREVKKGALDLYEQGDRLLMNQQSSTLNVVQIVDGRQSEADLRQAKDFLERALKEDPGFSKAAIRLGQAEQLLGDFDASIGAYRLALAIDPSDTKARILLGGVIIETGDTDLAIRELNEAARLDANNDQLHEMLARAFWDRGAWREALTAADRALALNPSNQQAHLWRADAARRLGADTKDPAARARLFLEARDHYRQFLRLTNFDSSLARKILFFSTGLAARKHADREESFRRQRISGFLGLCITEQHVGLLRRARDYCERALGYDAAAPMTHFVLGNVRRDLYNVDASCDHLTAAARHYATMVKLNPDLQEARNARYYLEQITGIAKELRCPAR